MEIPVAQDPSSNRPLAEGDLASLQRRADKARTVYDWEEALRLYTLALELPDIQITVGESSIRLGFPQGWLDDNPLTITDLEREKNYLEQVGYDLTFY